MKVVIPFVRPTQPEASIEALLVPHLDALYRLAFRWTGDPHDAEDLVQSLVAKLLPQKQVLAEVEDLRPWLTRALYNQFVDQTRRRSVSPIHLTQPGATDDVLTQIVDEASETPEQFAERNLTGRHLSAALMKLAPELRALVAWHDIEGYTLEEIAVSQSIAVGTLKSRLHRARGQLRELLIERFSDRVRED